MSDESSAGVFLGSALTNLRLTSRFEVQAEPCYNVRYQFVPVKHGPFSTLAGNAQTSSELVGAMLYFRPTATRLSLQGPTRLGKVREVEYRDSAGKLLSAKANVVNLWSVKAQDTLQVFFGLDALPAHRAHPLYLLGPLTRNCVVTVFEKPGKLGDVGTLTLDHVDAFGTAWYSGVLSGDTWQACTPPFEVAQARAILARSGISHPVVDAAMQGIYGCGISIHAATQSYRLDLPTPAADAASAPGNLRLQWGQLGCGPQSNPGLNITQMDPTFDVQARVHPHAYAAVIQAAVACNIVGVSFNSSWRPMLGPGCGHRHADCLDLGTITDATGAVHEFRWKNLTADEQEKIEALAEADAQDANSKAELKSARSSADKLTAARDKLQKKADALATQAQKLQTDVGKLNDKLSALNAETPAAGAKAKWAHELATAKLAKNIAAGEKALAKLKDQQKLAAEKLEAAETELSKAQEKLKGAETSAAQAAAKRKQAADAWQPILDAHMSEPIRQFRAQLAASPLVRQTIDPWAIDYDTRDAAPARTNLRQDDTERAHVDHLHLTCYFPELIEFARNTVAGA